MFRETLETGLPQHTVYDHEIKLKEGATPAFKKIYHHTEEQLRELKKYVEENKAKFESIIERDAFQTQFRAGGVVIRLRNLLILLGPQLADGAFFN